MDKFQRFLRNIAKGENKSARARRRLMERELNKLNNDRTTGDGVDGEVSQRDES